MSEQCLGPSSGTSLDAAKIRLVGPTGTSSPQTVVVNDPVSDNINNNNINNNNGNNNNTLNINNNNNNSVGPESSSDYLKKLQAESGKTTTTTTLEFSADTSEHYFTVASGAPFDYRDYLFDNTNSDLLDSAGPTPPGSADGGLSSKNSSNADGPPSGPTNFDFDLSGQDQVNRIPSLVTVGSATTSQQQQHGDDIGSPPIDNAPIGLQQQHQQDHQQQHQEHQQQHQQQQQGQNNLLLFDTTMLDAGSCGVGANTGSVPQQAQHGSDVHDGSANDQQQHSYVYNTPPPVLESSITSVQVSFTFFHFFFIFLFF